MKIQIGAGLLVLLLGACNQPSGEARSDEASAIPTSASVRGGVPVQTGPAVASATRTFRDWQAICDNGNACFAFGYAPDYGAGWVRISMPAGPDAEPEIAFGLWAEEDPASQKAAAARAPALLIDGRTFPGALADASDASAPIGEIRSGARTAITALAAGQTLEIRIGDSEAISTSGASAALLWIDERQGRLGTTTALLRRGERPASSVPQPATLPVRQAAPAADQTGFGDDKQTLPAPLRAMEAVQACLDEAGDNDWLRTNVMSARLDARTELWAVPCGAGAYNVSHRWYLTGPGGRDPRPADLIGSEGPRTGDSVEVWPDNSTINGGYDPATRTVSAFSKGRGIGDCGTAQTWVWTGRRFELQLEESMDHCAGVPPDYWPTSWRSR